MVAHLSLFSGIGAIDLGLRLAEPRLRTVGYVERDAFAAAVLVARMEEQALDQAPIWDDLATFPSQLYSGKVDLISAGFPCQPFSVAGKRKGKSDDRWLWPLIADAIDAVQPGRVFLENVPGLVNRGLEDVLCGLDEMGFDAEWGLFAASEVGAPHLRRRFFLLAHAHGEPLWDQQGWAKPEREDPPVAASAGEQVADPGGVGRVEGPGSRSSEQGGVGGPGSGDVRVETVGCSGVAGHRFPPPPDDGGGWREWLLEAGPEPGVRGGADGPPYRMDRLRALGNAAVPQCVAAAYRDLDGRLSA